MQQWPESNKQDQLSACAMLQRSNRWESITLSGGCKQTRDSIVETSRRDCGTRISPVSLSESAITFLAMFSRASLAVCFTWLAIDSCLQSFLSFSPSGNGSLFRLLASFPFTFIGFDIYNSPWACPVAFANQFLLHVFRGRNC